MTKANIVLDGEHRSLGKRRISQETCKKYDYRVAPDGRHLARYRGEGGEILCQKVRGKDKKFFIEGDAKDMPFFGQHLFPRGGQMLTITEGELDALSMSEVWDNKWPVVSLPTGAAGAKERFERWSEWLEGWDKVVLLFDQDEPGRAAALQCAQVLTPGKACIASLPLKDASDMLMDNQRQELIRAVWNAQPWRPEGIMKGDALISALAATKDKPATPYFHQGLNGKLLGKRGGEITVFCAGTGVGKSTFCRQDAVHMARQGIPVGYVALEGGLVQNMKGLLNPLGDRNLFLEEGVDAEEAARRWAEVADNIILFNPRDTRDADTILARVRYMIKAEGCKHIFLDNLSVVVGSEVTQDERKFIDHLLVKIDELAQQTDTWIGLVCHLKRPEKGSHEEGGRVQLAHLRGSGMIEKICSDAIAIERNQQDEESCMATVRVLKARTTSRTGVAGSLRYDESTGILVEAGMEDHF